MFKRTPPVIISGQSRYNIIPRPKKGGGDHFRTRAIPIDEILSFVNEHPNSQVARTVCMRILGSKGMLSTEESLRELKARLSRAREEVLDSCYFLVK